MLLELANVTKIYGHRDDPACVRVFENLDLHLERGESVAITGPSGCGKSTLLNLMGGLDRPTSGAVRLAGQDLARLDDEGLAAIRNRRIGFVFQQHHLLPQCTVIENVLIPTLALRLPVADRRALQARAETLLAQVGLDHRRHYRPGRLSGGESQRAAVVRALINRPALLLADEPTGSLDAAAAQALAALLLEINAHEGVTLVVVTHNPELADRMRRRLRLVDGHLI